MLDQLGGDQPSHDLYTESGEQNKDPMRVNAGLKAYVLQVYHHAKSDTYIYTNLCLVSRITLMYRTKQDAVLPRELARTLRSKLDSYCEI